MKKILYFTVIMVVSITFKSCASDEECVCDNGVTINEEEAEPVTLSEACDFAQTGGVSCEIK